MNPCEEGVHHYDFYRSSTWKPAMPKSTTIDAFFDCSLPGTSETRREGRGSRREGRGSRREVRGSRREARGTSVVGELVDEGARDAGEAEDERAAAHPREARVPVHGRGYTTMRGGGGAAHPREARVLFKRRKRRDGAEARDAVGHGRLRCEGEGVKGAV